MANAAIDLETIYSPEGEAITISRLNAIDLIRTSGYTWRPAAEAIAEAIAYVAPEIVAEAVAETLAEEAPAAPIDADKADLDEIAVALAGTDAVSYLNGFSVEALKTIAEQRYGEKLRGNISKEKAIERVLTLEEARIAGESVPEDN